MIFFKKGHSINKGKFLKKARLINISSALFRVGLLQELFVLNKNICFDSIQNGGKLNWVLQVWTEVCHQIFGNWEVTEEYVICIKKHVLIKKNLYIWAKYGFTTLNLG